MIRGIAWCGMKGEGFGRGGDLEYVPGMKCF